jgi:hypothetical protein
MPSPRQTTAGLRHTEKSGGHPTADVVDFEFAACEENSTPTTREGNSIPKIPDVADGIEVLHETKRNLEELRRGAGLNLLQITHLSHRPTCKEPARSSL